MRFLIFLALFAGGFSIVRYNQWIVNQTNIRFLSLQQYIGSGREYDIWKFIGIIFIGASFYVLVNGVPW